MKNLISIRKPYAGIDSVFSYSVATFTLNLAFTLVLSIMLTMLTTEQALAATEISKSLPSDNVTNVTINNHSGSINVAGWDKDKISVIGALDDEAQRLIFEQKGAQVLIKVDYRQMDSWVAEGSKITVFMPKNILMSAKSVSSEIHLTNLQGGVEIKTVSGDVFAKNLNGSINIKSISGDITTDALVGQVSISAVSGDVTDVASSGRLEVSSVSGEVKVNSQAKEVFFNNVSGKSQLTLANVIELGVRTVSADLQVILNLNDKALLNASTVSGDLVFIFQQDVDAEFSLKSNVGGDIANNITEQAAVHDEYGPGVKLNFATGNGSALVKVSTVSGDIEVSHHIKRK